MGITAASFPFPEKPPYAGIWRAVYFTPVCGSSERLTAFVVARGEDGQVCLRQTIRKNVLDAAFGQHASGLAQLFEHINESLRVWLTLPEIEWQSPFTGFEMGPERRGLANNIRQIAAQGIVMEAAFADPQYADLNQD